MLGRRVIINRRFALSDFQFSVRFWRLQTCLRWELVKKVKKPDPRAYHVNAIADNSYKTHSIINKTNCISFHSCKWSFGEISEKLVGAGRIRFDKSREASSYQR